MAKQIYQVRYYGDSHAKNQPAGLTGMKLKSGSVFSNYLPILQLGIQTIPGVKFYVNNSLCKSIEYGNFCTSVSIFELTIYNML